MVYQLNDEWMMSPSKNKNKKLLLNDCMEFLDHRINQQTALGRGGHMNF